MMWILLLTTIASALWRLRHKLPLVLLPLLLGAAPPPPASESFVDGMLELMLRFKTAEESDESKRARWRPLVEMVYAECARYAGKTGVKAQTCATVALNGVYWETGLKAEMQLKPKSGPAGEECFFQLHRTIESIPFPEWKPRHPYGTRHGADYTRCVEDGVRVFAYHMWRCHLDETKLRGFDGRHKLWKLYSEYYRPTPGCTRFSRKKPLQSRSHMAYRLLRRLPPGKFR